MPNVARILFQPVGRSYSFIADIQDGAVPPIAVLVNVNTLTEEALAKKFIEAWDLPAGAANFMVYMQTAVYSDVDEGEEEAELHNLTTEMLQHGNGETALFVNWNEEDIPDAFYPAKLAPQDNSALSLCDAVGLIKDSIASTNRVGEGAEEASIGRFVHVTAPSNVCKQALCLLLDCDLNLSTRRPKGTRGPAKAAGSETAGMAKAALQAVNEYWPKIGALARWDAAAKTLLAQEKLTITGEPDHAKYYFVQKSMHILSSDAFEAVMYVTLGAAFRIWLRDGHQFYAGCKEDMSYVITKRVSTHKHFWKSKEHTAGSIQQEEAIYRKYAAATAKGLCLQPLTIPADWKELINAAKPGGDITPLLPGAVRGPDAGLRPASGLAASSTFQGLQRVANVTTGNQLAGALANDHHAGFSRLLGRTAQAIDDAGQHGHRGSGSGSNTHALGRARAISGDAGLPERGNALRALAGPGVTALQRDVDAGLYNYALDALEELEQPENGDGEGNGEEDDEDEAARQAAPGLVGPPAKRQKAGQRPAATTTGRKGGKVQQPGKQAAAQRPGRAAPKGHGRGRPSR